jgi:cell division transport system permease protein
MGDDKRLVRRTQQTSRVSTVVSISLVLFLLGSLGVLLLHARKLSDYVKENVELSIVLKPEADSVLTNELLARVKSNNYIKSAVLISKEEAAASLKKDLGEDFISFLGFNPLNSSIEVRFRADFADQNTINSFISSFKTNAIVKEVHYQPTLIESVNSNVKVLTLIILAFSALLLLVSVALINNTIRIALYARRMLIKSMLLVGATKGFIRKPFLVRSIWNGLLGGIIAILLLVTCFYFAWDRIPELTLIRDFTLMGIVAGCMIIGGSLLSLICTWFAVNKYLRYRTEDLY